MKKFLSLAIVAAFLAASIGCDDKKSSPLKPAVSPSPAAPVVPADKPK